MRKWIIIFMIVLLLPLSPAKIEASVSARSAVLMEQVSGRVLYAKDAHARRRIASITKIMTAILAVESGKMNEEVKISNRAINAEGSSIYLRDIPEAQRKMKLEDLVYGLMLRSGNDAAVAIAEHVGGSLEGFIMLMNEKAKDLGMKDSSFANPHGLDDEKHYSSAYDMALLMRYAMQNETFRKISGTKAYHSKERNVTWQNKNRLLTEFYDYTTGGKTGFTKLARRTLVTSASKDGLDLISVTIDAPSDWNDHIFMYEHGFQTFKLKTIQTETMIKNVQDSFYRNRIFVNQSFTYPFKEAEEEQLRLEIKMIQPHKEWKDEQLVPKVVGKIEIYLHEKLVQSIPIFFKQGVQQEKKSWWQSLFSFIGQWNG